MATWPLLFEAECEQTIHEPDAFKELTMRKSYLASLVLAAALAALSATATAEDLLKPFVLGSISTGDFTAKVEQTKAALQAQGFTVVGEYVPYEGAQVIVVTDDELKRIAARNERGGYIAPQRVSVTELQGKLQVAYANPLYLRHAYRINDDLSGVAERLAKALGRQQQFGAEGLTPEDLRKYHYAFGMEYFDDPYHLADYPSYQKAVAAVEEHLASNTQGVRKIYRIDIPGTQMSVFGVGMKAPENGNKFMDDAFQMKEVDFKELRSTAYLPYEVLVNGAKVEALHMRFRMAVHFPDLKMMGKHSFMNLMRSPDAIHKALTLAVGGRWEEDLF